jgi:hypothetical protein
LRDDPEPPDGRRHDESEPPPQAPAALVTHSPAGPAKARAEPSQLGDIERGNSVFPLVYR